MGADAVEPDVVPTRDGVLVIRHENEISATTDVADRAEFAHLRRTKRFLGHEETGWFTEDFTWAQLSTLCCRERIPTVRPESARYDGQDRILRFADLLALLDAAPRAVRCVLEIKHAAYFASIGLDPAPLVEAELRAAGWWRDDGRLLVESFEPTVLADLRGRGLSAVYTQLVEAKGAPADLILRRGAHAPSYADLISPTGLDYLRDAVDAISLDKAIVLDASCPGVVEAAHARGMRVFCWTGRPENAFLDRRFRRGSGAAAFGDYRAEWELLRAASLDGVFVDHPDLAVDVFHA